MPKKTRALKRQQRKMDALFICMPEEVYKIILGFANLCRLHGIKRFRCNLCRQKVCACARCRRQCGHVCEFCLAESRNYCTGCCGEVCCGFCENSLVLSSTRLLKNVYRSVSLCRAVMAVCPSLDSLTKLEEEHPASIFLNPNYRVRAGVYKEKRLLEIYDGQHCACCIFEIWQAWLRTM
jgi:hypothetical protein